MANIEKTFVPGRITLITLLLASMIILMGAAAVAPALEPIHDHFGRSAFVTSLIVTLPALAVAITGFGMGYLADRFGTARTFIVSLVIFTIAGISGYFLNTFESILIGRFILGIGIAGISITTTGLIAQYYTGIARAKVIGYQSAAMGVGVLFLESIGGSLADIGWQEPFLIYIIGVPILLLGLLSIRQVPRICTDATAEKPTLDVAHYDGRKVAICYIMIFLAMFMMFALPTNLPYYITEMGFTLFVCGVLLGVLGVSQAVCSIIYSRSSYNFSDSHSYTISFALIGIGCCLLSIPHLYATIVTMVLVGVGMGLITPVIIGRLASFSQNNNSGKIMGGYSVAFNMGIFSSSLIMTPIIEMLGSYGKAFLVAGIAAIIIAIVCFVPSVGKKQTSYAKTLENNRNEIYDENGFPSILIATDGSENSKPAVEKGLTIAKNNGSKVTVIYVFDTERYVNSTGSTYSATELEKMEKSLSENALEPIMEEGRKKSIDIYSMVLRGNPAEKIIEESKGYSLVVCGSLGRTNLSRAVMGSVAEKVARMAYCPVLICRKIQH